MMKPLDTNDGTPMEFVRADSDQPVSYPQALK